MFVIPEDIAIALGRTTPEAGSLEFAQWEMWVNDAVMLITARLGDPNVLEGDKVRYVVREAVVAHIRKPDDATQVEIAVDDARSSRTYRTSKGRVTIIDEWWDLLKPSDTTGGAFSIRPSGSCATHLPWCSLIMGAAYCSCGVDIAGFPIFESGSI